MHLVRGSLCLMSVEEDTSRYRPFMALTENGPLGAPVSGPHHKLQGSSRGFDAEHAVGSYKLSPGCMRESKCLLQ
jgi:hypothetical protein